MLSYSVQGNGEAVVLLHGFLESSSMWQILKIENWPCKVITFDLPGHGKSMDYIPEGEPSILKMAIDVKQVLDYLSIANFSVVGHSMGGYVALELKAITNGCKSLILLNSTFHEDSDQKKSERLRVAEIAFLNKNLFIKEAIPRLFYKYSSKDDSVKDLIAEANFITAESISYASLAMRNRKNHLELVQQFKRQIFIIQGKHDLVINANQMKKDAEKFELNFIELDGTGHMTHMEEPQKLKEILLDIFSLADVYRKN